MIRRDTIYVLDLTCCFETNSERSSNFKKEKYKYIESDCVRKFKKIKKNIYLNNNFRYDY